MGDQETQMQRLIDDVEDIKNELTSIKTSLGKKVNWPWFFGTLLTELALIAGIMGAMFAKIEAINTNTHDTREALSRLEGKLEPFDFVNE
jgi:hypothetical protein